MGPFPYDRSVPFNPQAKSINVLAALKQCFQCLLDKQNQLTAGTAELDSYSLVDLLKKKIPKDRIEGRIVILGYDGGKMDFLDTPAGKMRAHRWFATSLLALWASGKS